MKPPFYVAFVLSVLSVLSVPAANGTRFSEVPIVANVFGTNVILVNVSLTNAGGQVVTRTRAIALEDFLLSLVDFPGWPAAGAATNAIANTDGRGTNTILLGDTRIGSGAEATNLTLRGVPKWGLDSIPPLDSSSELGWMQMQASGVPQLSFDGSTLQSLNASALASGTVNPARIAATFSNLPIYYVDGQRGSDNNHGRDGANSWATIAKAETVLGSPINNAEVRVYGNGIYNYREQLDLGTNSIMRGWGPGLPIFNAADVATNSLWALEGSTENVWKITWTPTAGGSATYLPVIEDGVQLLAAGSIEDCAATAGTFFTTNLNNPAAGSPHVVFIHPRDSTTPTNDTKLYEIGKRLQGIYAGDNNQVINAETRNNMGNNGSLEMRRDSYVRNVRAMNGTKHNALISSGLIEDSKFGHQEYALQSAALFVAHDTVDGLNVTLRRCHFFGRPDRIALASGILGHTSTADPNPGYGNVLVEDCTVEYALGFGSIAVRTNGYYTALNCKGYGLTADGFVVGAGFQEFVDCQFHKAPGIATSGRAFRVGGATNQVWISGAIVSGTDAAVRADENGSHISILKSILSGNIATDSATGVVINASNNILTRIFPHSIQANNTFNADSNCYSGFISTVMNGTAYANWNDYQVAFAFVDDNSTTNDMQFVSSHTQGDYRYADTSPAVTNFAGPDGRMSPRAPWAQTNSLQLLTPPKLLAGVDTGGRFNSYTNLAATVLFPLKTNGASALMNLYNPILRGSWTNLSAADVVIEAVNNQVFRMLRNANSSQNKLLFGAGTAASFTDQMEIGTRADVSVVAVRTLVSGWPVWVVGNNSPVELLGGGGAANVVAFADTSLSYGYRMDSGFDNHFRGSIIITNVTGDGFHGSGVGLSNAAVVLAGANINVSNFNDRVYTISSTGGGAATNAIANLGGLGTNTSFYGTTTFPGHGGNDVTFTNDGTNFRIEGFATELTFGGSGLSAPGFFGGASGLVGDDEAYGASTWNSDTGLPTKNAVRDKIETLSTNWTLTASDTLRGYWPGSAAHFAEAVTGQYISFLSPSGAKQLTLDNSGITGVGPFTLTGDANFSGTATAAVVNAGSFIASGSGSGGITLKDSDSSNTNRIEAPTDITASYRRVVPGAPATGFLRGDNASGVVTESWAEDGRTLTNLNGSKIFWNTNTDSTTTIDLLKPYAAFITNNNVSISGLVNVDPGNTNFQSAARFITNSTAAAITITMAAGFQNMNASQGNTLFCTNLGHLLVFRYPGVGGTNFYFLSR